MDQPPLTRRRIAVGQRFVEPGVEDLRGAAVAVAEAAQIVKAHAAADDRNSSVAQRGERPASEPHQIMMFEISLMFARSCEASCLAGRPNRREYSRLNCNALS
jgi:hypothetical protein